MFVMGPQINEEKPIAISTPALITLRISVVVPNSVAISGVAGSNEVLENVTANVIQLATNKMRLFLQKARAYPGEAGGVDFCSSSVSES
jgi:hypothetical protein